MKVDKWLYDKLRLNAQIITIFGTKIFAEYKYNSETLPALTYYDLDETYTKYNRVISSDKSIKIIAKTKDESINAKNIIVKLLNSDIQEKTLDIIIHSTKVTGSVILRDYENQCWITTIDINIIYEGV